MATPKGCRVIRRPVNESDTIHVYSDENHIWIQLRAGQSNVAGHRAYFI